MFSVRNPESASQLSPVHGLGRVAFFSLALLALMWVLPFFSFRHTPPIPSFYGEALAAALGLAAMSALLARAVWFPVFALPRIALLPLGLLVPILLQLKINPAVSSQMALLAMMYLLWAMMLMVLAYHLRMALGWLHFSSVLAFALLAGGGLCVVVVCLQTMNVHGAWLVPKGIAQNYANMGQANHFADYMAMVLVSATYLRLRRRLAPPLFGGIALLCLWMLALSGSRSAWLYLAAMTLLAAWYGRRTGDRALLWQCLALLPIFMLVQWSLPWLLHFTGGTGFATPTDRLFKPVTGGEMRLQIWHEAWQMFMSAPWLGVGVGQFDWHTFLLADQQAAGVFTEPTEHAHNLILHLMAELGLFAGLGLTGALMYWVRCAVARGERRHLAETWWMLALLAILGIHSLLEYPLWYSYFLGVGAVLLGAGETGAFRLGLGRIGRPLVLMILLLGGAGLVGLTSAYATLEKWVVASMRGQLVDRDLVAVRQDLMEVHRSSLLSPYVEIVLAPTITPDREQLAQKLQLTENAMRFSPIRAIVFRQAILLALNGDADAAKAQLSRAMRAYPADVPQLLKALDALRRRYPDALDPLYAIASKRQ